MGHNNDPEPAPDGDTDIDVQYTLIFLGPEDLDKVQLHAALTPLGCYDFDIESTGESELEQPRGQNHGI